MPAKGKRSRGKRGVIATYLPPLVGGIVATFVGLVALGKSAGLDVGGFLFGDGNLVPPPAFEIVRMDDTVVGTPEPAAVGLRDVTPMGVTPPPVVGEGPLLRVAPAAMAPAAPVVRELLYRRAVVVDAGSFKSIREGKMTVVKLAGIEAPSFRERCTDPAGTGWRCGGVARAELARLVGGRAISCITVEVIDETTVVGDCRIGAVRLSAWLVERGWADPKDPADAALAAKAAEAKAAGRGRFGPPPEGLAG